MVFWFLLVIMLLPLADPYFYPAHLPTPSFNSKQQPFIHPPPSSFFQPTSTSACIFKLKLPSPTPNRNSNLPWPSHNPHPPGWASFWLASVAAGPRVDHRRLIGLPAARCIMRHPPLQQDKTATATRAAPRTKRKITDADEATAITHGWLMMRQPGSQEVVSSDLPSADRLCRAAQSVIT